MLLKKLGSMALAATLALGFAASASANSHYHHKTMNIQQKIYIDNRGHHRKYVKNHHRDRHFRHDFNQDHHHFRRNHHDREVIIHERRDPADALIVGAAVGASAAIIGALLR